MLNNVVNFFSDVKKPKFDKYRLSSMIFYDERNHVGFDADDPFMASLTSLKLGGLYTVHDIYKEVLFLKYNNGMFEKVDVEYKKTTNNPDKTIAVTILFSEKTWRTPHNFRCINTLLGVTPDTKSTEKESYTAYNNGARSCKLPRSVRREVEEMMKEAGEEMSGRLLHKIKDKVEKWYHDEGYICAQVVNFDDLETNELEVVCEVMEGEITKLVLVKEGNEIDGNELPLELKKLLCNKLEVGLVYNTKATTQVIRNFKSLDQFSTIEVYPLYDGVNKGGVIVEIKLCSKTATTSLKNSLNNNLKENWLFNGLNSSFAKLSASDMFLKSSLRT